MYNIIFKGQPQYTVVDEKEALEYAIKKEEVRCFQYKHEKVGVYTKTYIRMITFENNKINTKDWQ